MEQNESVPPAAPETTAHDSTTLDFTDEQIFDLSNDLHTRVQHALGLTTKIQKQLEEARKEYDRLCTRSEGTRGELSPEKRRAMRNLNREIKERGEMISDISKRVQEFLDTP